MPAAKLDITIEQGTTFTRSFVWSTGPTGAELPVNLTGWSARMQIKNVIGASTSLLDFTTTNGRITLGTQGQITIGLTAVETAAIVTWTKGVYDLEMVSPAGAVTRLLKGTVTLDPEVTTIP